MFTVITPSEWPAAPKMWHFSLLKEIETCPKQWALTSAEYPNLWDGHGYPPMANPRALAGQTVHATVSSVCNALSEAGCSHLSDVEVIQVLRKMGGFTAILTETIDRILDRQRSNPRMGHLIERFRNDLVQDIPAMRQQVQRHLNRISLIPRASSLTGAPHGGKLWGGSYHELRLRDDSVSFVGIVDLLQIENRRCTIWEFKTGVPSDQHSEQLRTYALLWAADKERNPDGIPVSRMLLSYDDHVEDVAPPDPDTLSSLRVDLLKRREAALAAVSSTPPVANPVPEHCRFCSVRQLCSEYWVARMKWQEEGDGTWVDIEVKVGASRGPRSWDALVVAATGIPKETPVVLVLAQTISHTVLQKGMHVRLLNVRQGETEGVITVGISATTEVFGID